MAMYRADRPLVMSLIAIGLMFPGLWLVFSAILAVPVGLCLVLFAPGMLSGGLWMALNGAAQFGLGLAAWRGHPAMRHLAIGGPITIILMNLISGLTLNPWSPWTILLCLAALWYFRTLEAQRFLKTG